ncbi:C2H2-type domain-containing protein [Caenorhabditis elegans]|uniref:C2H2-type domain-containing protein n=1 Tax=Caenorhabditis elegans TaxID=6239 RepID=O01933_CAEEL|nr:C2H2-type domain-containing protein [Caenorhabditis elegans]CCD66483.1 C2H2-type domain-containing protein [Caenorhabditis elegans]|eukprot:NP_508531.2 Zinc finger putative Transcription Factor family [Caenorhabditis elegans]
MFGEEHSSYDPLISGLEPEPLETVFQELFAGIKNYFTQEETPIPSKLQILQKRRLNENRPQTELKEQKTEPKTRSRQFAMLRCGTCSENFVSQFSLEHHETLNHPVSFNWFCSECNVHFDTLQQASDHTMLTHGCGEMPVCESMQNARIPSGPFLMQAITRRSSDFVKEFLFTRDKQTVMTTAYYTYAKCELQAVMSGSIGLVVYNQAKSDLLATLESADHDDFVSSMKNTFIYGKFIKRSPSESYVPSATVFKTLTFSTMPPQVKFKKSSRPVPPGKSLGEVVSKMAASQPQYTVRSAPYSKGRAIIKIPTSIRNRNYTLPPAGPLPLRRTLITTNYTMYPVRNAVQ